MQLIAEAKIWYTIRLQCDDNCWKCCCCNGIGQQSEAADGVDLVNGKSKSMHYEERLLM